MNKNQLAAFSAFRESLAEAKSILKKLEAGTDAASEFIIIDWGDVGSMKQFVRMLQAAAAFLEQV